MPSDPNDFTTKYNTVLSPQDETRFRRWAKDTNHIKDLYDYDMRGAWQSGAKQAANGHFTDQFKKPNHPTFSNQSQYSGADGYVGGMWAENAGNKWSYVPSQTNLNFHSPEELGSYFKSVEPDSKLVFMPDVQPLPRPSP